MLKSLVWILIIFILGVAGYTGWIFYNQDQIMQIKRNPKDISLVWVRDQDLVMGKCEGAKIEHVFFEPNPAFVYFASQKPEQCFIFKLQDPILATCNPISA